MPFPATRCAAPNGMVKRCRPEGDANTTEVAEPVKPSAAPDRSSTIRPRMTIAADDVRTSAFVVDIEKARNCGADVSPIPDCVNVTPGAVRLRRLPT